MVASSLLNCSTQKVQGVRFPLLPPIFLRGIKKVIKSEISLNKFCNKILFIDKTNNGVVKYKIPNFYLNYIESFNKNCIKIITYNKNDRKETI